MSRSSTASGALSVLQLNAQRSKCVMAETIHVLRSRDIQVALLQEPYTARGRVETAHGMSL